jgi:hypothetical protein
VLNRCRWLVKNNLLKIRMFGHYSALIEATKMNLKTASFAFSGGIRS